MTVRVRGLGLLPPSARRPGLLAAACRRALKAGRARPEGELNLVFLGRAAMRRLNRRFLRHDWDTDVIAFPYPSSPAPDGPFGDVLVSAHMVRAQAEALGHGPLEEALTLAVHGTLHLVGHRDSDPRAKARMFSVQDRIVREALGR